MRVSSNVSRVVILCITVTVIIYLIANRDCKSEQRYEKEKMIFPADNVKVPNEKRDVGNFDSSHKLAVIIPFRNRFEELMEFAPWIHKFLNKQGVNHKIVVVNQVDMHRFNRASLINIGYLKSKDDCDYMVMHDVDLLPNNLELKYTYPDHGVHHLASPDIHPLYHYKKYVGGVLMLKMADFALCKGMSNIFWGWGREDDEFYMRMKENGLPLMRPTGIKTGYNTFKHIHDKVKRPRDYKRYGEQKKVQFKRDTDTGVDTVQYKLLSQNELIFDGAPLTVYNVELDCDKSKTPWCDHEKAK